MRIDGVGNELLGSGFFIAPGWVLTAAHVVFNNGNRAFRDVVAVTPAAADVGTGAVLADVVVHSDPPDGTVLWPFPDLALVKLRSTQTWVERHPCVWVAEGEPWGDDCHAYGFPPRERGVTPQGAPARFVFEGVDGDGFFRLKQGQAAPGLSGAALVCPVRRAVVGVMTGSRDRNSDLGGWAAPVSALLGELPGVPDELVSYGPGLVQQGAEAVLADRGAWHAVLPVAVPPELLPDWEDFEWTAASLPAEMLLADSGVVPYLARDEDLKHAQRWCEQPTPMEVWRLAGLGGAGKTRHAIELCRLMKDREWVVGRWTDPTAVHAAAFDLAAVPLPRLIVVDYVEAIKVDTLRALLVKLGAHASALAPVRVVLLTRTGDGAGSGDVLREIGKDAGSGLRKVLNSADDQMAIRGMSLDERRELYDAAFRAFRRAWFHLEPTFPVQVPDLAGKRYELPLEVLLEAFDHALSGNGPSSDRAPVDRALDHEARHWNGRAPAALPEGLRRAAVALATMAGADSDPQAHALLSTLPELAASDAATLRRQTVRWLAKLYTGPAQINPLRPDRLGEALVAEVLAHQEDGGRKLLGAVLALEDDTQVARSLDLLARLAVTDATAADTVAAALFDCHGHLVDRAETGFHGTADRPGRLDLAIGLQRLLASEVATRMEEHARAAQASGTAMFDLSMSYNKIGDLTRQSGQSERAEILYNKGLVIRERLSWAEPDDNNLARELSISYNKLGQLVLRSGQPERARGLYDKGLAIRERLAKARPGNTTFARDLAVSHDRLGELARETGRNIEAERLYRKVLGIRERLFGDEPANTMFARDLSISYDTLGDLALEAGRSEEARLLYEQGHRIREKLSNGQPRNTTFARDLSNSYDRLGDLAAEAGRLPEAKRRYEQALKIRQQLRDAEPRNTTFARDLSNSYGRLGDLATKEGRLDDAKRAYQLGLDIVEYLRDAEPRNTTFARDVSFFCANLGDLAARSGDIAEAERLYQLGRTNAERLLAGEPENSGFARDVAFFYEHLGELALAAPQDGITIRAETLLSAAVHFRRTLYGREPASVDLAEELATSLQTLARVGDPATVQRAAQEAIEILEPFERSATLTRSGAEMLSDLRQLRYGG